MAIEERLEALQITLAEVKPPQFSYVPVVQTGNLLFTSAVDCKQDGELLFTGKVGSDVTIEEGQRAAKQCVINGLSMLQWKIGDLNRIERIVKLNGFVQSALQFQEQPYVINGASDLLLDLFGEKGRHARMAMGVNELPFDTPVQIEMVVELKDEFV